MSAGPRVALVPGARALLPRYASLEDPVAELRAACLRAASWLGEAGPVRVLGSAGSVEVGEALLAAGGAAVGGPAAGAAYLVVGNGSACRSEKAPGHLDERAFAFDDALGAGLRSGDLAGVDLTLAGELWADVDGIRELAGLLDGTSAEVDYDDDPFGVKYWVMRWTLGSGS